MRLDSPVTGDCKLSMVQFPVEVRKVRRPIGSLLMVICVLKITFAPIFAEDWPEWRGKGRNGIWTESGILDKFPEKGLTAAWRTPIHGGFAGPAVAAGRVFVTDFKR